MSDEIPVGFLDPVSSRNSKWTAVSAAVMHGRIKRNGKNCLRVALSTEKPAQMLSLRLLLIYGIAARRLVTTVAPQNDFVLKVRHSL